MNTSFRMLMFNSKTVFIQSFVREIVDKKHEINGERLLLTVKHKLELDHSHFLKSLKRVNSNEDLIIYRIMKDTKEILFKNGTFYSLDSLEKYFGV